MKTTVTQRTLLRNLRNYGGLSVLKSDATTMRTVDALVTKGFVVSQPSIGGKHFDISLTDEGRLVAAGY